MFKNRIESMRMYCFRMCLILNQFTLTVCIVVYMIQTDISFNLLFISYVRNKQHIKCLYIKYYLTCHLLFLKKVRGKYFYIKIYIFVLFLTKYKITNFIFSSRISKIEIYDVLIFFVWVVNKYKSVIINDFIKLTNVVIQNVCSTVHFNRKKKKILFDFIVLNI
jgi:hypothetical protein